METDKRKTLSSNQTKRPGRTIVKNIKKRPENGGLKSVKSRETESKASVVRPESRGSRSDRNKGEAFETMVIHYADDEKKTEEAQGDVKMNADKPNDAEVLEVDCSSDLEKEGSHEKEDVSDDSESSKVKENVVENEANKLPGSALAVEEIKEADVLDEVSNGTRSNDERFDGEAHKNEAALEQKIEEMGMRIEKLEEELREVAALEISLYSVVPEHGSSAHKVHTPARRLSRLYIHACKHWTLDKRATIAKNTISGLILIAKSCSNDVPRLTFWLSNTMVLREIICQAFGSSRRSNPFARFAESNGVRKSPANLKWKGGATNKQQHGFMPIVDDWQETGTFVGALEKVESWIFSRMVESVWWQALTPYMQTPTADSRSKSSGKPLGPSLGDHKQGSFSIELWRNAFQDAFHRLCPVRGGGHDCGCLPVMARMVMKQCVSRLDVAMFNAILRESEHEIPTDPVSDPILDSKVLPIPAGDLSFGSGAQLKNSVGNWTRWLADAIGVDAAAEEEEQDSKPKMFQLLNELSDLLMLPKDMLMDRSIRKEVCPSISLTLVKRILCNFTPDEFCPDAVPGAVLEALNAESIVERRLSGETARSFPYCADAVSYSAPSSADVAEKVAEAGEQSPPALGLGRSVSMVQRKGYTSDEELEDLDSPLTTILDKLYKPSPPPPPPVMSNGNGNGKQQPPMNARYDLLREVWS